MDVRDSHGRFSKGRQISHSEETKKKIGMAHKGHSVSLEAREKIRQKLLGKSYLTEAGRKAIGQFHKGKKLSVNHRYNLSIASFGKPGLDKEKNPAWKGGKFLHEGYVYVKKYLYPSIEQIKDFPADKDGYVKRANVVWFLNTGEIIKSPYFIHHKNGHKKDDGFKNLEKTTRSEHFYVHKPRNLGKKK